MADEAKKVNVNLYKKDKAFTGNKDGKFYYMFPTSDVKYQETQIAYWLLIFDNELDYDRKCQGDKDVKASRIVGIRERGNEEKSRLSGTLRDNDNKQKFYINLYDNKMKGPGKDHDMYITIKETEWTEYVPQEKPF